MPSNVSNTPCPLPLCPHSRYPHLPLCWEHWRTLPDELRHGIEQAVATDRHGPTHLAAFKQALGYHEREAA